MSRDKVALLDIYNAAQRILLFAAELTKSDLVANEEVRHQQGDAATIGQGCSHCNWCPLEERSDVCNIGALSNFGAYLNQRVDLQGLLK